MHLKFWLVLLLLLLGLAACMGGAAEGETADLPTRAAVSQIQAEGAATVTPGSIEPTPELPTATVQKPVPALPDLGPAPEIRNEVWVNAEAPVTLASQRGKVVLIEFWTFG